MAKHMLLVFTNAAEGKDDEFNRWYNDVHLGDVLSVDGFVAAQRFDLKAMDGPDSPHRYLALYEVETDDVDAVVERLGTAAGKMVISDAMADASALVASPITDRRT
ncbi:MAG: hypothetical protein JRH16_22405 [Deltaproteobacteria bacterium]|nr:hypothetical protein [Deltaproteobacteria bacterium]